MIPAELRSPTIRLRSTTGQRSAVRGRTDHLRPMSSRARRLLATDGPTLAPAQRFRPQSGPVAGCTPDRCWHQLAHWAWTAR